MRAPAHRPLDGGGDVGAAIRAAALDGAVGEVHLQVVHAGAVCGVAPARQPAEPAPATLCHAVTRAKQSSVFNRLQDLPYHMVTQSS